MTHQIDKDKAQKRWRPIIESLNIKDEDKIDWMSEYAEYHTHYNTMNESVGYSNLGNLTGMGSYTSPAAGSTPGVPGNQASYNMTAHGNGAGSGDYGQQLLPVAMKIAAQTIGLDLVPVKPSPGPVIDLMYVDYRYDDGEDSANYNPMTFKIGANTNISGAQNALDTLKADCRHAIDFVGAREKVGSLTERVYVNLPANGSRAAGQSNFTQSSVDNLSSKEGVLEFLGFSRIDGQPMFRSFRTTNAAVAGAFNFDQNKNTFNANETITDAFEVSTDSTAGGYIGNFPENGTTVELVSTLEDHLPGFSSGYNRNGAMNRSDDENTYPGVIGPNVTTKRVTVGTVEVTSSLKRTEIEDIKAQTGIDIVQKLESVLINELSQTISKEIVEKVFDLGDRNRGRAPTITGANAGFDTEFDFDVDSYFSGSAPGGETTQSAQRKLLTKIDAASNFISTEGRIGPAQYIVTNGKLASVLKTASGYQIAPSDKSQMNAPGQLYPMGQIGNIQIYVDPYQKYNDGRIVLGRKNNPDQPGLVFVPYLMAQSIRLISEATFAPRMLLRSRYAVAELGFFPQTQYMTININDSNGVLA